MIIPITEESLKQYIQEIVETEKYAINIFASVLKDNLPKRYTIVTQDLLNMNRDMYLSDENIIVVKIQKGPYKSALVSIL